MRLLVLAAAAAGAVALGWSDPVSLAATSVAVAPTVAVTGGRLHVFWLDRSTPAAAGGELWHAVLSPDGRQVRSPSRLQGGVDTRLGFPVATAWGPGAAAAWMTRGVGGVSLEIAILDGEGSPQALLRPDPAPREEAGRIGLAAADAGGPLHVVWSAFDRGRRQVWYARIHEVGTEARSSGGPPFTASAPRAVAAGDAPAIMLDPQPRVLWWDTEGAGDFRLMVGDLTPEGLASQRPLTGAIALVAPLPVLPARAGEAHVVLIPTIERAFSTAGRLYGIRLDRAGRGSSRIPLLGRTRVADLSVAHGDGQAVAVWSQPTGRRQNSELYAARLSPGEDVLETPTRITFSIPGSLKPGAAVVGGHPAAVWLEVTGFGRFSLSFATSQTPRRRLFLLGIPELDLFRPGPSLLFVVLTALSVLPIALVVAAVTLIAGTILVAVAQMLAAPFRRIDDLLRRPGAKMGAVLAATGAVQVGARALIPGQPHPLALAGPLACLAIPALWWWSRRPGSSVARLLTVPGIVLAGTMVALFAWGARQLSQF